MRSFLRMLEFLRPLRRGVVLSLVLSSLAIVGTVAIPLLLGQAIDAIKSADRSQVLPYALAIVGAGLLRLALSIPRRLIAGRVSLAVEYDLRNRLYAHLQSLELGFFDRQQVGQLMSRATVDLQSIRFFLGYGLVFILQNLLTILFAAIVMFVLEPALAAITLAPVPFVIAAATRYGRYSRPALQEVQQRIAELTAEAEENISGIRIVKAFARERYRFDRFGARVGRVFDQSMYATRLRAFYNPLISFLPNLGLAAVLLVGGRMVVNGSISLGEFAAFNSYVLMLMFPMRMLGIALGMAQRAVASGNRVFEILDRDPRIEPPAHPLPLPPGGGRVRFDHVTLSYNGGVPALADVSLEVAPGETVAVVGPTGSGKTTLVAAIARLYDVSSGSVSIDGRDVRDVDPHELRRAVALVPDDGFLFSATVGENIAYARPDATPAEIELAARRAQIHSFIETLPDGYDTLVGERGLTLSGGQRQRIAIARALITDPRVLILDDATASVDAATEREIKRALREVMEGRTTFVIAHRLSTIMLADRIAVMEDGRITAIGTHEELLEESLVYGEIVEKGLPRLGELALSGLDDSDPDERAAEAARA
ncbi:MAG: ABC transporter ATP-binding protein [Candidatus Rokuibacteriota bacterium]|nr:MAG: ABC transporter ATP-binding protein [Candidatus Rokubacteria bacterium]